LFEHRAPLLNQLSDLDILHRRGRWGACQPGRVAITGRDASARRSRKQPEIIATTRQHDNSRGSRDKLNARARHRSRRRRGDRNIAERSRAMAGARAGLGSLARRCARRQRTVVVAHEPRRICHGAGNSSHMRSLRHGCVIDHDGKDLGLANRMRSARRAYLDRK